MDFYVLGGKKQILSHYGAVPNWYHLLKGPNEKFQYTAAGVQKRHLSIPCPETTANNATNEKRVMHTRPRESSPRALLKSHLGEMVFCAMLWVNIGVKSAVGCS